jgi:hypothetical protein
MVVATQFLNGSTTPLFLIFEIKILFFLDFLLDSWPIYVRVNEFVVVFLRLSCNISKHKLWRCPNTMDETST